MRLKELKSSKAIPTFSSPDSGLYLLLLRVNSPIKVGVGALGRLDFGPGYYVYCGSARRALSARLRRHLKRRKKRRWHIDYLTCRNEVAVESVLVFSFDNLSECVLNASVLARADVSPVSGFGCSDCKCRSHLTAFGASAPRLDFEHAEIFDG